MKHLFNKGRSGLLALAVLAGSSAAHAGGETGVDYSDMLEAIDFTEIATGVVGAGAALLAVYLAIKGVRIIIGMVKGG